jgi:hypothetical protein
LELITGRLYRIRSRNLPYGVYDGFGGFVGIREKFGSLFLDTEYDQDTAVAVEELGAAPSAVTVTLKGNIHANEANQELYDFLAAAETQHGRGVGYGGRPGDPVEET